MEQAHSEQEYTGLIVKANVPHCMHEVVPGVQSSLGKAPNSSASHAWILSLTAGDWDFPISQSLSASRGICNKKSMLTTWTGPNSLKYVASSHFLKDNALVLRQTTHSTEGPEGGGYPVLQHSHPGGGPGMTIKHRWPRVRPAPSNGLPLLLPHHVAMKRWLGFGKPQLWKGGNKNTCLEHSD